MYFISFCEVHSGKQYSLQAQNYLQQEIITLKQNGTQNLFSSSFYSFSAPTFFFHQVQFNIYPRIPIFPPNNSLIVDEITEALAMVKGVDFSALEKV